jgi:hypothetical protein
MAGRVMRTALLLLLAAGLVLAAGCSRGQPRERRPTVIIPDMEFQKKLKAQEYTPFFADHRAMRTPPEGTVARGTLKEDSVRFQGKDANGEFVTHNAREVTMDLLLRGQNRFNIYCSPCHDRTGSGKGMVIGYGFVPPPNFSDPRALAFADGYIFDVISHGVRNMPSYGAQIPADDRWAIVAYVRALQRSRTATLADVPAEARKNLETQP